MGNFFVTTSYEISAHPIIVLFKDVCFISLALLVPLLRTF